LSLNVKKRIADKDRNFIFLEAFARGLYHLATARVAAYMSSLDVDVFAFSCFRTYRRHNSLVSSCIGYLVWRH